MGEVGIYDEDVEDKEKSLYEQALATCDSRTSRVLSGILEDSTGAPGGEEGASVGICRVNRTLTPSTGREGAGRDMRVALLGAGITPGRLADDLRAGLGAWKRVYMAGKVRRVPDYAVRLRYLELAHRLRGDIAAPTAGGGDAVISYEERILAVAGRLGAAGPAGRTATPRRANIAASAPRDDGAEG